MYMLKINMIFGLMLTQCPIATATIVHTDINSMISGPSLILAAMVSFLVYYFHLFTVGVSFCDEHNVIFIRECTCGSTKHSLCRDAPCMYV